MKAKVSRFHTLAKLSALAAGVCGVATAGITEPAPIAPAPAESVMSGVLSFDFNSHFISYGADVWKDGSSLDEWAFNPLLELTWALPGNFSASLGAWADVNSKGTASSFGGSLQELDVWAGLAYTYEKLTVGVTYQNWIYGGGTEDILDIKFSYDTFLSPSLTIHNRLDEGASGGDTGTVLVLGLSHDVEAGPVTFSFPFNIAYFVEDGFHGGDDGFGYCSLGASASIPISFIGEMYGSWSLNAGLTYYITSDDVIPGNPDEDFLTAMVGVKCEF